MKRVDYTECWATMKKYEKALTQIFDKQGWVWVGELLPPEIVEAVKAKWNQQTSSPAILKSR